MEREAGSYKKRRPSNTFETLWQERRAVPRKNPAPQAGSTQVVPNPGRRPEILLPLVKPYRIGNILTYKTDIHMD
jgi:hypothetical protein